MRQATNVLKIEIEGVKELDKVLAHLPKTVAKQQLKAALRQATKPMVKDARARAKKVSPSMARSIKVRIVPRSNVPAAITLGPDEKHWWGVLHEFGTGIFGPKKKEIKAEETYKGRVLTTFTGPNLEHPIKVSKGHPATPFMRPAYDTNKNRAVKNFGKNLWFVLDRMAQRLVKQAYAGKLSKAGRKTLGL